MIDVAILGYGVVGSGTAEVLIDNAKLIEKSVGQPVNLKYILDIRDFSSSPLSQKFTKDFGQIEADKDVRVVIEVIGGVNPAYDFTKRALAAGKSVVTSNKELVACHGAELLELARANNVNYLFEASVGGGIPVIRPINQCLSANRMTQVAGILNGTTNYVLTKMITQGVSFDSALKEAQEKGYAERNPDSDILGHDTCRKICILASLCFGRHVYPQYVKTQGITGITLTDVDYAAAAGMKIKLLGRAVEQGGLVYAYVAPHFVPKAEMLANVEDVFNGVMVSGNAVGQVMFYGPGAGKLPTASAVVADVIDAARHPEARKQITWQDGDENTVADADNLAIKRYIRLCTSASDIKDQIAGAFGAVEYIENPADAAKNQVAFITGAISQKAINTAVAAFEDCEICAQMPVLGV